MKIATRLLVTALALGALNTVAGPGAFPSGGTNVCFTNVYSTNLVGTNLCSTNLFHTNLFHTNVFSKNYLGPLGQYDLDHDGTITSNEFAAVAATMVAELESRFLAKYDTDQDGTVTAAEALAVN